ncbi:hypothetical protein HU200_063774 [Digitaria exilis]|uniref:Uncharacterized protein n=1 Tax=Digitaria exilis TaxID=1010633 RepID=A0A835DW61_9POAL|nr:hypothetical protein HU200_063774 [Digitaria exilis]CAB3489936.1 unnamed protein product [Digitaria exilis]
MRQWKSLVPALHLHAPATPSCFPQPPAPSPCPSPPREEEDTMAPPPTPPPSPPPEKQVVRLVGTDGRVRAYPPPVTARELMQEHPCHLVCRSDALLIGEKIPAVAPGDELEPGKAYFLLPAHLFHSVLSFVSLASSLLLMLTKAAEDAAAAAAAGGGGGGAAKAAAGKKPFELHRMESGALQIKFSDDFLAGWEEEAVPVAEAPAAVLLGGDKRLAKDYEELVGYSKSRRWAPKLETIEEVVAAAAATTAAATASPKSSPAERKKSRGALPFLGHLGSRRRHRDACGGGGGSAVACSG